MWCEKKDIWIYANHINSKKESDVESRRLEPETEYAKSESVSKTMTSRLGIPETTFNFYWWTMDFPFGIIDTHWYINID